MTSCNQVNSKTKIDDLSQKDLSLTRVELFLNMVEPNSYNQENVRAFNLNICNEMHAKISKIHSAKALEEEDENLHDIKSQIDKSIDNSVNLHSLLAFVVIFALLLYVVVPYESHILPSEIWLLYAVLRTIDVIRVINFERKLETYAHSYSSANNKCCKLEKSRILIELTRPKIFGNNLLDAVNVAISIVDRCVA